MGGWPEKGGAWVVPASAGLLSPFLLIARTGNRVIPGRAGSGAFAFARVKCSIDLINRAQVTPHFVRPAESYEAFSHETGRFRCADVAKLREQVRAGIKLGWSRLVGHANGVVRWEVNSAGECAAPVVAHFRGVALPLPRSRMPIGVREYLVTCLRRCRQCEWCKMMRSSHWAHRAATEFGRSPATWLGTITLSPFHHAVIDARVAKRAHKSPGCPWLTEWSAKDRFRARAQLMGVEISKWLKRIRKAERQRRKDAAAPYLWTEDARYCVVPCEFKYLLVAEEHKSERTSTDMVGRPHYHILIHELYRGALIRPDEYYITQKGVVRVADSAMIKNQWQFGFSQFELCRDSRSASYLCKYLSKDMLWRVRASQNYGKDEVFDSAERSEEARGEHDDEANRANVRPPQRETENFKRQGGR